MATVTGFTAARMLLIEAASVVNGFINEHGHLILTRFDESTIDAGYMIASVPDASTVDKGIVRLATEAEVNDGLENAKAVTPESLGTYSNRVDGLETDLGSLQTNFSNFLEGIHEAQYLPDNSRLESDPLADYPEGLSIMNLHSNYWDSFWVRERIITWRYGDFGLQERSSYGSNTVSRRRGQPNWVSWYELLTSIPNTLNLTELTATRLRGTSGTAPTLSSTGHPLQIGENDSFNLRLGRWNIEGVNNGVKSPIYLQEYSGGQVRINSSSSGDGLYVGGQLEINHGSFRNHILLKRGGWTDVEITPSSSGSSNIPGDGVRLIVGGTNCLGITPSGLFIPGNNVHFSASEGLVKITYSATSQVSFRSQGETKRPLDVRNDIGGSDQPGLRSFATHDRTTTQSANLYITADSNFSRSTSSSKYKKDIEDVEKEYYENILLLRPVWYRSQADMDRDDWSYFGLVAEEVAQIEPRLVHWGHKDGTQAHSAYESDPKSIPEGDLVPEGVMYDRVAVLTLKIVQEQAAKLLELEDRIASLEAQLAGM